jgi:1-acyl-sn-glycerol-3-phosphate acyltransferase
MFNKILYIILNLTIILSLNNLFIASHFINKQKVISKFLFNETLELTPHIYTNLLNGNIYSNGEYKKTNKIDIVISNHINFIDWAPIITTIRQYDDRYIYIIMKKQIKSEYPIIGGILKHCSILISRNSDEDKQILNKLTSTITNSIILIFPEGTRYNKKYHLESIQYSLENNLPVMKKTLYPKMKGIYQIISELKLQNKLGNLIDCTLIMDKILGEDDDAEKIFKHKQIKTYIVINNYNIPKIDSYKEFKNWFIKKWYIKNDIITNYEKLNYNKITFSCKKSYLILIFLLFIITIYLFRYHPILYVFLIIIFYLIHAI